MSSRLEAILNREINPNAEPPAANEPHNPSDPLNPPTYTIDLDLPPRQRHQAIGKAYKDLFQNITPLFDEIISPLPFQGLIKFLSKLILRRVYNAEELEEIYGLVEATGVPLYLIVAFNSFLDTFMGCTSGAVKLRDSPLAAALNGNVVEDEEERDRMLHFRTLDWGMDVLRPLIIRVSYVRGGKEVAQAVSYAGYVGVLTGVRYVCGSDSHDEAFEVDVD